MPTKRLLALILLAAPLAACDDEKTEKTENPEETGDRLAYWEQQAAEVAKKNAGFELSCQELSTETLDRNDAVMVKWYSIGVTGCGKKVLYEVTCANQQCDAERKSTVMADPNAAAPAAEGGETTEGAPEAGEQTPPPDASADE